MPEDRSLSRKYVLWNWGGLLLEQERFENAIEKYADATKIEPPDALAFLYYGNSLAAAGKYRDAIKQFDKASKLDPHDPYHHHNKAYFLFELGDYEKGWNEWVAARLCYEIACKGELRGSEQLKKAAYFADVWRDIFRCYKKSEEFYGLILEQQRDDAAACTGLALLFQQWANSDQATSEIHAQLSYLTSRASEALKRQLGTGNKFQTYLSLADLYIETSDWTTATQQLDWAEFACNKSTLKRAEVAARRGLVCFRAEEHAEAAKNFREALLVKPGDLTLRSNLGNALLKLKQFEAAQDEFARVLKLAPGNIEALVGAAQVSIEIADDGDPDQYQIAEHNLTEALTYGRNKEWGSKRLENTEIAKIYYMRGYVRTKSYETGATRTLSAAHSDFKQCKKLDPNNRKAPVAIEKITKRLRRSGSEPLVYRLGELAIFFAAAAIFLFAQLDFFFGTNPIRSWVGVPDLSAVTESTSYIAITFGSLLFMVAGLYLPKVLKLKVPGIELEKASVDQVSAPSTLGISHVGSLRCGSTRLRPPCF